MYGGCTHSAVGSQNLVHGLFNNTAGADVLIPLYFWFSSGASLSWSIYQSVGNPGGTNFGANSAWGDSAVRAGQVIRGLITTIPTGVPIMSTVANAPFSLQVEVPVAVVPPGYSWNIAAAASNGNSTSFGVWWLSCPPDELMQAWTDQPR